MRLTGELHVAAHSEQLLKRSAFDVSYLSFIVQACRVVVRVRAFFVVAMQRITS